MDERSIVTPSDLDAAIRAQQSRRWDALWMEAQQTGLATREWIGIALLGLAVLLVLAGIVVDPSARTHFMDVLPQCSLFLAWGVVIVGVYVRHTSRQLNALRKLLHGVLTETANLPPGIAFEAKSTS